MGTFNCWGQITLALWEDGEEQRLLTIGGTRCSHRPGEAPGCARHWEAACPLVRGDGAVPWFICASPSLSSLERNRSRAFKKSNAIFLLNLELKIPGGAAHGLCSPQVGGSFVPLTGLARGEIRNCIRLASPASPLPGAPQYAEARPGGIYRS